MHSSRSRFAVAGTLALVLAACGGAGQPQPPAGTGGEAAPVALSGTIKIDGSSTVFPISEAMAEEFQKVNRGVRITVGISGTGGGFKKFCAGETDVSDASRPIKDSEKAECEKNGISYHELQVAIDGLSVVVNKRNDWVDCLTTAELRKIWDAGSTVRSWNEVRPGFPDMELKLYGAGTDSGTFDYFTEAINGKEKQSRSDYTASEDDNTLVQGVSGNRGALGYFGYAYYVANQDALKILKIDGGAGCVEPDPQTIESYTYKPLARPIFIYPSVESLKRPEVKAFIEWYLGKESRELIDDVGYVVAPEKVYADGLAKLQAP